ncbi:MAG: cation diffusion facilitator family transporter [Coriobacteriales bacterium]|nr:cation diffusion facilitator family transporter [Coriobacteriales bacterium]
MDKKHNASTAEQLEAAELAGTGQAEAEPKKKHGSGGMFAVVSALCANIAVAISKFVGFSLTGSTALLSESVHSLADCSNQALLLFGDWRAKAPPTKLHNFGYSRSKYFFSMMVAVLLFTVGGVFSFSESWQRLHGGEHEVTNLPVAIGILIVGFIIEAISLSIDFREINRLKEPGQSLPSFIHNTRYSEVLICVLEDSAATLGLLIALGGTLGAWLTGNPFWDSLSGLVIGVMLIAVALVLAYEFYSLLIGESVKESDLVVINNAVNEHARVTHLIDVKTVHLSPEKVLICIKTAVEGQTHKEISAIVNEVEASIRSQLPYECYIYIEVDEWHPELAEA